MPENPINPKYLKYTQGAYKALGGDERFTSFDNFQSQLVKDEGFRIQVYKDLGGNSVVGEQAKFDHIITLGNIAYQKKKDGTFPAGGQLPGISTPERYRPIQGSVYQPYSVAPDLNPQSYDNALNAFNKHQSLVKSYNEEIGKLDESIKRGTIDLDNFLRDAEDNNLLTVDGETYVFSDEAALQEYKMLIEGLKETSSRAREKEAIFKSKNGDLSLHASDLLFFNQMLLDTPDFKAAPKGYGWVDRAALTVRAIQEGQLSMGQGMFGIASDLMVEAAYAVGAIPPDEDGSPLDKDQAKKSLKDTWLPAYKEGQEQIILSTPEKSAYMQEGFWGKAYYGAMRSVPAMATPYMSGIFLQTYAQLDDELSAIPDMSENEKAFYKGTYGLVSASLERFGFRNLMRGTNMTKVVMAEVLKKLPKSATIEVLEKTANNVALKYAKAAAAGAMAEYETGFLQAGAEVTVKEFANFRAKNQGLIGSMKTPKGLDVVEYMFEQGALEAAGSLFIGQASYISQATKENKLGENIDDADFINMEMLLRDPTSFDALARHWEVMALNGTISEKEATDAISGLFKAREVMRSMPKMQKKRYESLEARRKVYDLLSEKYDLNQQLKEVDESAQEAIKARIKEINASVNEELTQMEAQVAQYGTALPEGPSGKVALAVNTEELSQLTVDQLMSQLYGSTGMGSRRKTGTMLNMAKVMSQISGSDVNVVFSAGQDARNIFGRAMHYNQETNTITINPDAYVQNVYAHEMSHPFIEELFIKDRAKFDLVYEAVAQTAMRRSPVEDLQRRGLIETQDDLTAAGLIKTYGDWANYVAAKTQRDDAPVEAVVELMADVFNKTYNRTPVTTRVQDALRDVFNAVGMSKLARAVERKDIAISEAIKSVEAADIFGTDTMPIVEQALKRDYAPKTEQEPVPSGEQEGPETEQAPVEEERPEAPTADRDVQTPQEKVKAKKEKPSKVKEEPALEEEPVAEEEPMAPYFVEKKSDDVRLIKDSKTNKPIATIMKAEGKRGWVVIDNQGNEVGKKRLTIDNAIEEARIGLNLEGEILKSKPTPKKQAPKQEAAPKEAPAKKQKPVKEEAPVAEEEAPQEEEIMSFKVKIEGASAEVKVYRGRTENGIKYGDYFIVNGEMFMIPDRVEKGYKAPTEDWFNKRSVAPIIKAKLDTIAAAKARKDKAQVQEAVKKAGIAPTISEVAAVETREKRKTTEEIVVSKDGEPYRIYRPQTLQVGFKNKNGEWVFETKKTKAQFEKDYVRNFPKEEQDDVVAKLREKFGNVTTQEEAKPKPVVTAEKGKIISQGDRAVVTLVDLTSKARIKPTVATINPNNLTIQTKKPRSRYFQETQYATEEEFQKELDKLQKRVNKGDLGIAEAQKRKYGARAMSLSEATQSLMDEETDILLREAKKAAELQKQRDEAAKARKKEQQQTKVAPESAPTTIVEGITKKSIQSPIESLTPEVRGEMLNMLIEGVEEMAKDTRGSIALRSAVAHMSQVMGKSYEMVDGKRVPIDKQFKNAVADLFRFEEIKAEAIQEAATQKGVSQEKVKYDPVKALKDARTREYDRLIRLGVSQKDALERAGSITEVKKPKVKSQATTPTASFFQNLGYAPAETGAVRLQVNLYQPKISDVYRMLSAAQSSIAPMTPKQLGLLNTLEEKSKEEIRNRMSLRYSAFVPKNIKDVLDQYNRELKRPHYVWQRPNIEGVKPEASSPFSFNLSGQRAGNDYINSLIHRSALNMLREQIENDAPASLVEYFGETQVFPIRLNEEALLAQLENAIAEANYNQEEVDELISNILDETGNSLLYAVNANAAAIKTHINDIITSTLIELSHYEEFDISNPIEINNTLRTSSFDSLLLEEINAYRLESTFDDDYAPAVAAHIIERAYILNEGMFIRLEEKPYVADEGMKNLYFLLNNKSDGLMRLLGASSEETVFAATRPKQDIPSPIRHAIEKLINGIENQEQEQVEETVAQQLMQYGIVPIGNGNFTISQGPKQKQGPIYTRERTAKDAPKIGQRFKTIKDIAEAFSFFLSNEIQTRTYVFMKDGAVINYMTTTLGKSNASPFIHDLQLKIMSGMNGADAVFEVKNDVFGNVLGDDISAFGRDKQFSEMYSQGEMKDIYSGQIILSNKVFSYLPPNSSERIVVKYDAKNPIELPRLGNISQTGGIDISDWFQESVSLPAGLINQLEGSSIVVYLKKTFNGDFLLAGTEVHKTETPAQIAKSKDKIVNNKIYHGASHAVVLTQNQNTEDFINVADFLLDENLDIHQNNVDVKNYMNKLEGSLDINDLVIRTGIDYLFKEISPELGVSQDEFVETYGWGKQFVYNNDSFDILYDNQSLNLGEFAQAYSNSVSDMFDLPLIEIDFETDLNDLRGQTPELVVAEAIETVNNLYGKYNEKIKNAPDLNAYGVMQLDAVESNIEYTTPTLRFSAFKPTPFSDLYEKNFAGQTTKAKNWRKPVGRGVKESILDKRVSIINFINKHINNNNAASGRILESWLRTDSGKVINASKRADAAVLKAFGVTEFQYIPNNLVRDTGVVLQARTILETARRRADRLSQKYKTREAALAGSTIGVLQTDKADAVQLKNSLNGKIQKTNREIARALAAGDLQRANQLRNDLNTYQSELTATVNSIIDLSYRIAVVKGTTRDIKELQEDVKNPGGMTTEQAKKHLESIEKENPEDAKRVNEIVDRIFEISKSLLDEKLNEGLITQSVYDALADYGYSPRIVLQRLLDQATLSQMRALSQNPKGGVKSLGQGTELEMVTDPVSLIQHMVASHHKAVNQNKLNEKLYNFVKTFPAGNGIAEVELPLIDKKTGKYKTDRFGNYKYGEKVKPGTTVIEFMQDGKNMRMRVNLDFYSTWASVAETTNNKTTMAIMGIIAGGKVVKQGATIANPSFALVNIVRDLAFVLGTTDGFSKYSVAVGAAKAIPHIAKGYVSATFRGKGAINNTSYSELYDKALEGGFALDFVAEGALTVDQIYKRLLSQRGTDAANRFKMVGEFLIKGMLYLQETTEIGTRLAIFNAQLERLQKENPKMNQEDMITLAAHASRKHLDYAIVGNASSTIELFKPYSNAMIRAVEQTVYYYSPVAGDKVFGTRVFAPGEKNLVNVFAFLKTAEFAIGYALIMYMNNAIGTPDEPEDEKGAKRLHDLEYFSNDLKDRNIVILTGEREKTLEDGSYDPDSPPIAFILPMTQEQQAIIRLSQEVLKSISPELSDMHTDNLTHAVRLGAENTLPFIGQGVSAAATTGKPSDIIQNMAGQIPGVAAYIAYNYNKDTYTDSYIMNPYDFNELGDEDKYDDRTRATFISVGQSTGMSPKNLQVSFEKYATSIDNNYFLRLAFSVSDNMTYQSLIDSGVIESRIKKPEAIGEAVQKGLIRRFRRAGNSNWRAAERYDELQWSEERREKIQNIRKNVKALAGQAAIAETEEEVRDYMLRAINNMTEYLDPQDEDDLTILNNMAEMFVEEISKYKFLSRNARQVVSTANPDERANLLYVILKEEGPEVYIETLNQIDTYQKYTGKEIISDKIIRYMDKIIADMNK